MLQTNTRPISAISDMATMSGMTTVSVDEIIIKESRFRTGLFLNGFMVLAFSGLTLIVFSGYRNVFNNAGPTRIATALQLSVPSLILPEARTFSNGPYQVRPVEGGRNIGKTQVVTPEMLSRKAPGESAIRVANSPAPAPAKPIASVTNPQTMARTPAPSPTAVAVAAVSPTSPAISVRPVLAPAMRAPLTVAPVPVGKMSLGSSSATETVTINFVTYKKAKVKRCGTECLIPFETTAGQKFLGRIADLKDRDALLVARGAVNLEGTVTNGVNGLVLQISEVKVNSPFAELDRVFSIRKSKNP